MSPADQLISPGGRLVVTPAHGWRAGRGGKRGGGAMGRANGEMGGANAMWAGRPRRCFHASAKAIAGRPAPLGSEASLEIPGVGAGPVKGKPPPGPSGADFHACQGVLEEEGKYLQVSPKPHTPPADQLIAANSFTLLDWAQRLREVDSKRAARIASPALLIHGSFHFSF
ncbi:unnamed protein product [Lampetra fluviatilis]